MLSGIKCDKFCINLNDLIRDASTWICMFLVKHSFHNRRFCSYSTQTDFYRFFVKASLLVSFILVLHDCVYFSFKLFPWQVFLSSNVLRKRNSVFVSIKSKRNLSNSEQNYRMLVDWDIGRFFLMTRVVLEIKRAWLHDAWNLPSNESLLLIKCFCKNGSPFRGSRRNLNWGTKAR